MTLKARLAQERQLLRCVSTGNVERRIGFGETEFLRFGERVGVGPTVFGHSREDDIARAVDDADQRVDSIGDQSACQRIDDRNAAAATGFGRAINVLC